MRRHELYQQYQLYWRHELYQQYQQYWQHELYQQQQAQTGGLCHPRGRPPPARFRDL